MNAPPPPCDHDGCPTTRCNAEFLAELQRLKQQLEVAIGCVESGLMVEMNEEEKRRYGPLAATGGFIVGNFEIRRRK